MAEFAYNNAKNASTSYTLFEINCRYHPRVSYKKNLDFYSKSKSAKEISFKLQKLITFCQQNLDHAQALQKWVHNKNVKSQIYTPGEKVWLKSKHLKTKRNC